MFNGFDRQLSLLVYLFFDVQRFLFPRVDRILCIQVQERISSLKLSLWSGDSPCRAVWGHFSTRNRKNHSNRPFFGWDRPLNRRNVRKLCMNRFHSLQIDFPERFFRYQILKNLKINQSRFGLFHNIDDYVSFSRSIEKWFSLVKRWLTTRDSTPHGDSIA